MNRTVMYLTVVLAAAQAGVATADGIRYLGRGSARDSAVIVDDSNRAREVRKGDAVAGVGEVTEIDDAEIAIDRIVTDEERAQLRAQGLMAPDIVRIRIARPPQIDSPGHSDAALVGDGVRRLSPPSPDRRSP